MLSSRLLQPCRQLTFYEIQLATENFDESLVIGRGGFGKVYKGTINIGANVKSTVAIKRLDSTSNQGASEFWAEVKMLSKLRHCNLVSLIGYCNDGQEMILVYEYMPLGTLEDHLHTRLSCITWVKRLKICIGAARGLDYLHTGTGIEHGVIHRDFKSSNILLHDSWEAKISDFGLSKVSPRNQPSTYVNTLVKGTFGYLDPNYFQTGRLTRKSDVYAFGVVLFEVLCGKRAVDSTLDEEHMGFASWAQDSIKMGRLKQIVDCNMRGTISSKCLRNFGQLANRCLHSDPKQRPTMAQVVVSLESILALQETVYSALRPSGMPIFGRKLLKFILPFNRENSGYLGLERDNSVKEVINNHRLPSIVEEQPSFSYLEADNSKENDSVWAGDDINKSLPSIEGLQVSGEAIPGHEIQACGYAVNGTTCCAFRWVRQLQDGSISYIEGATNPVYIVTADDVDRYIAVEVQPTDGRYRMGKLVKYFANEGQKITCDPIMLGEIQKNFNLGRAKFNLSLWKSSSEIWVPATLEIKSSSYKIKLNGPNGSIIYNEKYTPNTVISLPTEKQFEFSIIDSEGFVRYMQTDYTSTDINCSRDVIVLTMRLFKQRVIDNKRRA
ncbi:protein kinase-like domain, Concanavalin A-like lectin/glucanase domain protein [Artemisia annua]|uniref:Protein kinase-like domain, Concanavalin A-like lectin/glucanase domain protein n=1 Tax=Artemisia annua TaxID=35608 RepID=A0A2U1NZ69_ARTAN|nr:protein kinase-like domain, Concanavalin A-like lectin/glucanase domain protein [Artemisia annua]